MYIYEAVMATSKENPYITRRAWQYVTEYACPSSIWIQPTNSPDCCIVGSETTSSSPRRGWQPTAEDLVADDWEVVKF